MFTDNDKKILQVGGVALVVVALGLIYYIWAVVKYEVQRLDKDNTTAREQIDLKTKELAELQDWKDRQNEIRDLVAELEKEVQRLPTEPEAREFFGILRDCIRMTNLTENKITRLKNVDMGAYDEIPYQITCRARYHDLGQFLALVEQHKKQIMRIKTLDITNDLKRPSRHPVTLRVATFIFTEPVPKFGKEVASK